MARTSQRLRDLARLVRQHASPLEVAAALEDAAACLTASPRPDPAALRALLEACAHAVRRHATPEESRS